MTEADRHEFARIFAGLLTTMRWPEVDPELAGLREEHYFQALQVFDLQDLAVASEQLRVTPGGIWAPTPGQWAEVATEAHLARQRTALAPVVPQQDGWTYYCETCSDTGWELQHCTDGLRCGSQRCAQGPVERTHTYVRRCQAILPSLHGRCHEVNPAILHRRQAAKERAEQTKVERKQRRR